MNDDLQTSRLSRSIFEEVIDEFSRSGDTVARLVAESQLEVRDFMALSLVCDQQSFGVEQLVRALGLSRQSVLDCIERLELAGLLCRSAAAPRSDARDVRADGTGLMATPEGRRLTRRILGAS